MTALRMFLSSEAVQKPDADGCEIVSKQKRHAQRTDLALCYSFFHFLNLDLAEALDLFQGLPSSTVNRLV